MSEVSNEQQPRDKTTDLIAEQVSQASRRAYRAQLREFAVQYFGRVVETLGKPIHSISGVSFLRAVDLGIREISFGRPHTVTLREFVQVSMSESQAPAVTDATGRKLVRYGFGPDAVVDPAQLLALQNWTTREEYRMHSEMSGLPDSPQEMLRVIGILHSVMESTAL